VREARGAHVALLSQDAEPADERWLERLLEAFALAADAGIAYGPYVPRSDASVAVRMELERWFASLAPDGAPRIDRLAREERERAHGAGSTVSSELAASLIGARGFFTDANACLARSAWEQVPFRDVAYAEDRALALDMLRAGYAKVYVPRAAVLHSHAYAPLDELRRCFDEWRGLRDVYGWREPASPARTLGRLRGELGYARREMAQAGVPALRRWLALAAVARRTMLRLAGALLGSRSQALPAPLQRALSLERRAAASAPRPHEGAANPVHESEIT
jgi:rhamnosyltransferase